MDYHLNPLVKKIPSYIKDTNDFLLKLQQLDDISSKSLLVTLNVISLYTTISRQEGLDACRETLNKREVLDPPTEDIFQLALIILKKNNFSFRWEFVWPHYMQMSLWASLSVTLYNGRGKNLPSGGGL